MNPIMVLIAVVIAVAFWAAFYGLIYLIWRAYKRDKQRQIAIKSKLDKGVKQ